MAELTKEHFDKVIAGLTTRQDFKQLDTKADKTSVLVANLVEDIHDVPATLKQIRGTQTAHGNILDNISKNTKDWREEMEIMQDKLEKYEKAIKFLANKLNLDVASILN
jgi:predicted  nucleic acid-binding Zn-ribbon protein